MQKAITILLLIFSSFLFASPQNGDSLADAAYKNRLQRFADSLQQKHYSTLFEGLSHSQAKAVNLSENDVRKRIQEIHFGIPVHYSGRVMEYIEYFQSSLRPQTALVFAYAPNFFPYIEEPLRTYSLPADLKWLPAVLSFMNPAAALGDGLSGLWQLSYTTANFYGLKVSSFTDERRDPALSSMAAAKYLSDLYSIYNDWNLSLTAYLCGAPTVNKAIRRAKGNASYSSIYEYLPKEYRDLVPAYMAWLFVVQQQKKLNLQVVSIKLPPSDTVLINQKLFFTQISQVLNVDEKLIAEHNPMYKRSVIPGGKEESILRLPLALLAAFRQNKDSIYKHLDSTLNLTSIQDAAAVSQVYTSQPNIKKGNTVSHKVKAGESLSLLSRRYHVSVNDIKKWNKLKSSTIHAGQVLAIHPLSTGNVPEPTRKPTATPTPANTPENTSASPVAPQSSTRWHTVSSGESFYSISKKYEGISADDIMKANNLTNPQGLKVGQKLKIPVK